MATWLIEHRKPVVVTALVLWAAAFTAFLGSVVAYDLDFFGPVGGPWVFGFSAFAITGAFITWQRPDHVMGLLFLGLGVIATLANASSAVVLGPFAGHGLTLRTLLAAVGLAIGTASYSLLMIAIVTFPDGRLPSARWRWFWAASTVTATVGATAAFLTGAWGGDEVQAIVGPPFDGSPARFGAALLLPYHAGVLVLMVASWIAIVLRYRRSDGTTRRQIRWLVMAMLLLVALVGSVVTIEAVAQRLNPAAEAVAVATGLAFVPVSVTIAILRHRLFDIDVVLNRTIVFGLLAAFITSLYVAIVVGVGTLVGDRSNPALTVGATALVAAGFEPARARVQNWANIAVYGRRVSPYEVLATIASGMGSTRTGSRQLEAMARLLADGTGAQHATVWVAAGDDLRAAACSPQHDPDDHAPVPATDVGSPAAEVTGHLEPVTQDGQLIGALSVERRRDDPVTPSEQRLVAELAGQASLVLGHARLQVRLQARLEDLRASRGRLVATQDEARRRLERDLHDGAQQQLVALKVKLGMARAIAGREDAGEAVARRLEELSATADHAVDNLRSLARGIYPPLLEAEGLERAIAAHASSAPIHVAVRAEGVRRYGRQVEATIYFCIVEALGNTIRHGGATSLEIVVEDLGDQLAFTLTDDGCGFDPTVPSGGLGLRNMADRVDAVGGSFAVETAPGSGVRLRGAVPVAEHADAAAAVAPVVS